MAAIDSPVELPITPVIIDLKDAYRDPTRFKSSAMESLTIQPIKTTYSLNDKHGNQKYKNGIKKFIHMSSIYKREIIEIAGGKDFLISRVTVDN